MVRGIMVQQASSLEDPGRAGSTSVLLAAWSEHVYEKQVKLLAPNNFLIKKANKKKSLSF